MVCWLCVFLFVRNRCKKNKARYCCLENVLLLLGGVFGKSETFWDVKAAKTGALVVVLNANKMCR